MKRPQPLPKGGAFECAGPRISGIALPVLARPLPSGEPSSADRIGVLATMYVYQPLNRVSGTPVSCSATWDKHSFNSLGLTTGTYTWTWGSGGNADSFVPGWALARAS